MRGKKLEQCKGVMADDLSGVKTSLPHTHDKRRNVLHIMAIPTRINWKFALLRDVARRVHQFSVNMIVR